MLSHEDNETLVRVGRGTPMGNFMRLFWVPFLPSSDLTIDGHPQRVRLFGEDLVAFRDSEGRVGVVDQACAHRGAPLIFGRNHEGGIRCVYHGWQFGVDGRVLDAPCEPAESRLKDKVRIKSYPCQERNGIVWAYMGEAKPDALPPLPNVEWNLVPAENVHISLRIQECNWLQALEGEIDSAHAAILHSRVDDKGSINEWTAKKDLRPVFECERREFGMSVASRRVLNDEQHYWRVNQFMFPYYSLVPPMIKYPELSGHAWVPIDDENTLCLMFSYTPVTPLYEKTRKIFIEGYQGRDSAHASQNAFAPRPITQPYAKYWTKYNLDTAFRFDEANLQTHFCGLPGLWPQDAACQSGIAPIYDRSRENLGVSDTGVAMTRRLLLEKARKLAAEGDSGVQVNNPDTWMVRAVSLTIPADVSWKDEENAEHMRARIGKDFGYTP
jgi:phthalate 4,5-dioxygenase oxygenase subunit